MTSPSGTPTSTSTFDVVVVGAGLTGLVAAARYLQANPAANLTLLEHEPCLGGVWSEKRIFPGFWSQTPFGVAEFADLQMEKPDEEEECGRDMFRAKYITEYLEKYADFILISGRSLRERIRFSTSVKTLTKVDGLWHLECFASLSTDETIRSTLFAQRIIMANGLCTVPRMPLLPGKESFSGCILHSKNFGQSTVLADPNIQHVTVLGAGKSSLDMIYDAIKAGKTVSWIVRKTGDNSTGPGFFAPADAPVPIYRNVGHMAQTRLMASLQPCFLREGGWWTWFVNSTRWGVGLVNAIFGKADEALRKRAAYKERESDKGFEKLEYESSVFWSNGVGGVLHHPDTFDLIAANVQVYRAKVKSLHGTEVYLDDDADTHFPCDALLCGTGYERDFSHFTIEQRKDLGLPYPKSLEDPVTNKKWEDLVHTADKQILSRFMILRDPPPHTHLGESRTPYRLYNGIASLTDPSIVFLNHVTFANKTAGAEIQAMWATAYFDGNVVIPPISARERNVATWIAWNKRRYLSNGELGVNLTLDVVPYIDVLMKEMGLTRHKGKGWLRDFFAPVLPADLGRAWKEYLEKVRK